MPLVYIGLGIALIWITLRGKLGDMVEVLSEDLSIVPGKPNFVGWVVVILVLGFSESALPKEAKPVASLFLILVVLGFILANNGFFQKFQEQALR